MNVTGLGWLGTRTARGEELAAFYRQVLGLRVVHQTGTFWVFELPDGHNIEVFGVGEGGKDHFTTGPVAGFVTDDLATATAELERAGIELIGEPGPTWQHFVGPDGNVYALVADSTITTPQDAISLTGALARGLAARSEGRLLDALGDLAAATRDQPDDAEAWYWYARTQDDLAMEATAIPSYEAAIARGCADEAGARAYLANSLQKTWRAADALPEIALALQMRPDEALFWFIDANALADLGQFAEAESAYRRALDTNPGLALAWHHLGQLLGRLGRPDEAEAAYEAGYHHGLDPDQT